MTRNNPIREVVVDHIYYSASGIPFKVIARGHYGLNCTVPMIAYCNLIKTKDAKSNSLWFLEESIFLKTFKE